jgi:hypothetical protein
MSYIKLDIENLEKTRENVKNISLKQDRDIARIRNDILVNEAKLEKSRNLFAVDSGFNTAYDTPFSIFKAVVVDEKINIEDTEETYLFHVDNFQNNRLRRLLMQQTLYDALSKAVETSITDDSMVLIDGTITLTVFYPTPRDNKEYQEHFKNLYQEIYSPLMDKCLEREILLLGFLKRSGSTYLAENLGVRDLFDIHIINAVLKTDGQYIQPIPVVDTYAKKLAVKHKYVTFYLNLKGWNYRFELLKQQEESYLECIKNLLYWATDAYNGMNPVFSKADEYARVTKREANLKFNYIIHHLSEDDKLKLRLRAKKKTHFNYRSRSSFERFRIG